MIYLNGKPVDVLAGKLTAGELRQHFGLGDSETVDLWLEHPGLSDDTRLNDADTVTDGMTVFSSPRTINDG
jgi:hypothetical protein